LARRTFTLLAGLLSAALLAALPAGAVAAGDCTPAASWPADRADLAAQVVALVNAHRTELGLAPLVVSPTLTATAQWKARNMAAFGYLEHDDPAPDARTSDERVAACGYQSTMWGENIAMGYSTAQAVFAAWMGSPGHRANIERAGFRATGVGAAGSPTYWAQSFGATVDAGSVVPAAVGTAPASDPAAATPSSAMSLAPAHAVNGATVPVRVSCAQRGRRIACRVVGGRGSLVRIALMRRGRTFAKARTRMASDAVRLRLHTMRRLRAGRYALVVRAGQAAGASERRTSLVVR
jgi:uncharacterized protein YkwD